MGDSRQTRKLFRYVTRQPPRLTQPGHFRVGRRNEYQRKLGRKQAHRAIVQTGVWLRAKETEISVALWALWLWGRTACCTLMWAKLLHLLKVATFGGPRVRLCFLWQPALVNCYCVICLAKRIFSLSLPSLLFQLFIGRHGWKLLLRWFIV